jgi:hypothetical protein
MKVEDKFLAELMQPIVKFAIDTKESLSTTVLYAQVRLCEWLKMQD